jgi:hypothetical protein
MLVRHVALVVEKSRVKPSEVSKVAAALQKQVTRDFSPMWEVRATVDSFTRLEDVPIGYWPVIVMDKVQDAAGYHDDQDGQPFSLVEFDPDWPLTASHEVLEMLADPFGRRLVAGQSPRKSQGRVSFLVEVCDPCEDTEFAYTVNGILVSDFYTPEYFDPTIVTGKQYSYTGAITAPRQVLKGGYLSWRDPVSKHWFQLQRFSSRARTVDLGARGKAGRARNADDQTIVDLGIKTEGGSLRAWVDRRTNAASLAAMRAGGKAQLKAFHDVRAGSERATKAKAIELRAHIRRLTKPSKA